MGKHRRSRYGVKSSVAAVIILPFVFLAVPAHVDKGQSSFKLGRDLEARQDYEAAFNEYQRAYDANPRNTQYRAAFDGRHANDLARIKFLAP